jgi:hypothetical protein
MELFLPAPPAMLILVIIAALGAFAGAYFARRPFLAGFAAFVVTLTIVNFTIILGYFFFESINDAAVHLSDYGWDAYLMGTAIWLPALALCLWVPWIVAATVVRLRARRENAERNLSH